MRSNLYWQFPLFIAMFLLFTAPPLLLHMIQPTEGGSDFGAEFGNIATALATGRGFSDPFGIFSGPTAWAAPVYPFLLAAIFKLFGVKSVGAFLCVTVMKGTALAFSGVLLFRLANLVRPGGIAVFILVPYILLLISHPWMLLYSAGDEWLLILTSTTLLVSYCNLTLHNREPGIYFGLFGGFCALVHPALGLAFVVLVLLPKNGISFSRRALMALLSILMIAPWVGRNYIEFERFIPVKSNASFEAYQGNVLAPGGIYTSAMFEEHHPSRDNYAQVAFLNDGETIFLDNYKKKFQTALSGNTLDYVIRMANRTLAIFVLDITSINDGPQLAMYKIAKGILYSIPALVFMTWIILGRYSLEPRLIAIHAAILISTALPFIAIGFFARYRLPLLPIFASLIFLMIVDIFQKRKKSSLNNL